MGLKNFNKKNSNYKVDEALMLKIFTLLPTTFDYIVKQLSEGIVTGTKKLNKQPYLNYTKFSLKTALLNKYENKKGSFFQIKGIRVFDLGTSAFIDINIDIAYDLLIGYSTPSRNPDFDLTNINVDGFYNKHHENDDFKNLSIILDESEIKLLNEAEVYEVILKGLKFYHIKDLEDGDFIGIDINKKLYKITHDPFTITELALKLSDIV